MPYIADHWQNTRFNRRRYLKLAALSTIGVAIPVLTAIQKSTDISYEDAVQQVWQGPGLATPLQEMVYYATLAPSHYNSQPWRFEIADHTIRLFPDRTRHLTVSDPNQRALMISLGSALENLVMAANHLGYGATVRYLPKGESVAVQLDPDPEITATRNQVSLFKMIARRRSSHASYSSIPVSADNLAQIEAATASADTGIQLLTAYRQLRTISDAVQAANLYLYSNPAFLDEQRRWLRFNETDALHHRDGLFYRALGKATVPRWWGSQQLNHLDANAEASRAARLTQQASGLALIVTRSDDEIAWIKTGRAYERFALQATALGIQTSLHNSVIEVPQMRSQIRQTLALEDHYPQLLIRFGHGPDAERSLRRPLSEVLTSDQGLPVESTVHQI